jgi:hypothetical protein
MAKDQSVVNDQIILSTEPSQRQGVQSRLSTRFGSMDLVFEVEQQVNHAALAQGCLKVSSMKISSRK